MWCVTRTKRQTPGTPKKQTKQVSPAVNPKDPQSAQLTDQAPCTIDRAAQESSRTTPTSTATVHASITATPLANITHTQRCYTEKATPARHRPERQYNACANSRKQCSPNETKSYSNTTPPRKRQSIPTNGHNPRRMKPTHTRLTYTRMRPHAPSHQAGDHPEPAHTERHSRQFHGWGTGRRGRGGWVATALPTKRPDSAGMYGVSDDGCTDSSVFRWFVNTCNALCCNALCYTEKATKAWRRQRRQTMAQTKPPTNHAATKQPTNKTQT